MKRKLRKNRISHRKEAVMARYGVNVGVFIMVGFLMVLLNHTAQSHCEQTINEMGRMKREIAKLQDEVLQESTRWEQMKSPEKLNVALLRHGLRMETPKPCQNVYMKADGSPYPGQLSVAAANRRREPPVAMYRTNRKR